MENSDKIINWSIENSEELSLKAEFYTGIHKYMPDIYDVGIYIKIAGQEYYGRGSDLSEKVAYCKAFSEAVERASLDLFDISNSSGLAVHSSKNSAKLNAKLELLERDAFLCKFFIKSGFSQLDFYDLNIFEKIKAKKINISFYEMCKYENLTGVLCVLNGHSYKLPFGNIMGTSCSHDIEEAKWKSLIETLRLFLHLDEVGDFSSLTEEEFCKLENVNFSHHGKLSLDLNYSKDFLKSLEQPIVPIELNLSEEDFSYNFFDLRGTPLEGAPVFLVKAFNPKLQDLFTGRSNLEKINLERLKRINSKILEKAINFHPHPFD